MPWSSVEFPWLSVVFSTGLHGGWFPRSIHSANENLRLNALRSKSLRRKVNARIETALSLLYLAHLDPQCMKLEPSSLLWILSIN